MKISNIFFIAVMLQVPTLVEAAVAAEEAGIVAAQREAQAQRSALEQQQQAAQAAKQRLSLQQRLRNWYLRNIHQPLKKLVTKKDNGANLPTTPTAKKPTKAASKPTAPTLTPEEEAQATQDRLNVLAIALHKYSKTGFSYNDPERSNLNDITFIKTLDAQLKNDPAIKAIINGQQAVNASFKQKGFAVWEDTSQNTQQLYKAFNDTKKKLALAVIVLRRAEDRADGSLTPDQQKKLEADIAQETGAFTAAQTKLLAALQGEKLSLRAQEHIKTIRTFNADLAQSTIDKLEAQIQIWAKIHNNQIFDAATFSLFKKGGGAYGSDIAAGLLQSIKHVNDILSRKSSLSNSNIIDISESIAALEGRIKKLPDIDKVVVPSSQSLNILIRNRMDTDNEAADQFVAQKTEQTRQVQQQRSQIIDDVQNSLQRVMQQNPDKKLTEIIEQKGGLNAYSTYRSALKSMPSSSGNAKALEQLKQTSNTLINILNK